MYDFVSEYLSQPFALLYVVIALAIINLWRKRKESRKRLLWVTIPFILFTVLSMPAAAHLALGSLEWQYPPLEDRPTDVEAIVILGGGVAPPDGMRLRADLDRSSLLRCLRGADLYHRGKPCLVLVSGGKADPTEPGPAVSEAMSQFLALHGVPAGDLIVENRSATTYENAVECCKLLKERGLRKIILVTDGTHLMRATGCFRKQGIDVIPCGCAYRATPSSKGRYNFAPSPKAAIEYQQVCHEWVGTAWYWINGRI
jgi:uncharacterized SAM-binding protein YcdF (DUF218 family)